MSEPVVPEHGDVVIVPEVRQSHLVYVMHINGGGDQLAFQTRDAASARALTYAQREEVSAWYGDRRELGCVLLGCFRPAALRHNHRRHRRA